MKSYFEPDSRWELYGIANNEQFVQQFVVKGFFHEGVPKDVKDAYTTVEYLLAHAYYFWPMFDEAFNKALRVLEMAVKLKAKQLSISSENIKPNKKIESKKLIKLIEEICNKPHLSYLNNNLNRARKIRNSQMHPDSNSYMGGIGGLGKNLKLFVNVINDLFRSDELMIVQFAQKKAIEKQIKTFENNLVVLDDHTNRILVSSILDFLVLNKTLILVCNLVLRNTKQVLEEHKYLKPIGFALFNYEVQKGLLTGSSNDGHEIKIYKTMNVENLQQYTNHLNELNSVNQTDRALYEHYINGEASWSLVELEYNYLSKNLI